MKAKRHKLVLGYAIMYSMKIAGENGELLRDLILRDIKRCNKDEVLLPKIEASLKKSKKEGLHLLPAFIRANMEFSELYN